MAMADSPHQEPRVLSKQMRSIDEKRKNTKIQENFELLDADIGTGPGPVSCVSDLAPPATVQLVVTEDHMRSALVSFSSGRSTLDHSRSVYFLLLPLLSSSICR